MIKQGINPYTQASFSLQNRLARLIWGMTYLIFIKFSPRPMHRYRAFLLTLFGAKLGKDCQTLILSIFNFTFYFVYFCINKKTIPQPL